MCLLQKLWILSQQLLHGRRQDFHCSKAWLGHFLAMISRGLFRCKFHRGLGHAIVRFPANKG